MVAVEPSKGEGGHAQGCGDEGHTGGAVIRKGSGSEACSGGEKGGALGESAHQVYGDASGEEGICGGACDALW